MQRLVEPFRFIMRAYGNQVVCVCAVWLIIGDSNNIGSVKKQVIHLEYLISHSWTNWGHLTKNHSPLSTWGFQAMITKKTHMYVKDIIKNAKLISTQF